MKSNHCNNTKKIYNLLENYKDNMALFYILSICRNINIPAYHTFLSNRNIISCKKIKFRAYYMFSFCTLYHDYLYVTAPVINDNMDE